MSVKCGHCKGHHPSVASVRACALMGPTYRGPEAFAAEAKEPAPTLAQEPSEGIFLYGGAYYKVQQNLSGTSYYVKKALLPEGPEDKVNWAYEGRAPLYFLTEDHRVTGEQAAEFGHVTGACVFCGRKLTDERSISVGYGPVCAENQHLPWGEAA